MFVLFLLAIVFLANPPEMEAFQPFFQQIDMSNEKNPGCLGCIGDYTTQFYGDFNTPYKPI